MHGSLRENCNQKRRTMDIKPKWTKASLAELTDCASYSPLRFRLHSLIVVTELVQKMSKTKIKLFSVTSVNFRFISNVRTLIIQITGTFKTMMNPGLSQNVAAQFFLSIPYLAAKTSWLVLLTLIVTSQSGRIQKMIMIVLYY